MAAAVFPQVHLHNKAALYLLLQPAIPVTVWIWGCARHCQACNRLEGTQDVGKVMEMYHDHSTSRTQLSYGGDLCVPHL